jgi:pimeloyl-ACP methyl ester carboxylesterase
MASSAVQIATQRRSASNAPSKPLRVDRVATGMAVALPDGRRVSLECWPGEGAPLVLLHGLLDCAVGWKHLAEAMDRPCYAVDLPGFGDSDCPTRNRISAYAEDVQAALAALDVHDFTLVGHSLGGAVAAGLAERLRDDVAALVLIAPSGFGRIHLAEAIQLPGVRSLVRHGLPLALQNPVTALGVYMAFVGNGHRPDPDSSRGCARTLTAGRRARRARTRRSRRQGSRRARSTADSFTTTGRYWRCGATATGSSRSLTAMVSGPHSRKRRSASGRRWATTPSASVRASSHSSSKPPAGASPRPRASPHRAPSPSVGVC